MIELGAVRWAGRLWKALWKTADLKMPVRPHGDAGDRAKVTFAV